MRPTRVERLLSSAIAVVLAAGVVAAATWHVSPAPVGSTVAVAVARTGPPDVDARSEVLHRREIAAAAERAAREEAARQAAEAAAREAEEVARRQADEAARDAARQAAERAAAQQVAGSSAPPRPTPPQRTAAQPPAPAPAPATPAPEPVATGPATSDYEARLIAAVNAERRSRGLAALSADPCADGVADAQAERMRREGRLSHSDLQPVLARCGASAAAENVAVSQESPEAVVARWMASEGHRKNILDPGMTHLGTGAVRGADGRWWAAQVFLRR